MVLILRGGELTGVKVMVILPEGLFELASIEINTANTVKELKAAIKYHSDIPVEY